MDSSLEGATPEGRVEFTDEGDLPMEVPLGSELDGRLITNLANIPIENYAVPNERFFIRTRASKLLDLTRPWLIKMHAASVSYISAKHLDERSSDQGTHVTECAGNTRKRRFGLLSAAQWSGVRMSDLLEQAKIPDGSPYVCVSGFDSYSQPSQDSIPGASWIFSAESLIEAGAFLATRMNGASLAPDHGSPVRLMIPGWYGCSCIKWITDISFMNATAQSTSQMREYAGRTGQAGVPDLARDYRRATMEAVALPVRVEKWRKHGLPIYRIIGISWGGGKNPPRQIAIRFDANERYQSVEPIPSNASDSWRYWQCIWRPTRLGKYTIQLTIADRLERTTKLDAGYYTRAVFIDEL